MSAVPDDPGRQASAATPLAGGEARLVVGVTLLAAVLRFATLDAKGYWEDEIATLAVVGGDLRQLWETLLEEEGTPPLYYLLAWAWAKAFGTGEVGLRSLSALLGTATVPVAYAAGRVLVSRRVGLVAALLVAVNPLLVWYSQEARAYALLVLLGGASFALAVGARRRPSPPVLAAWAVTAVLVVLTHYYGAFLVAAQGAWLVAVARPRRGALAAVAAVGAVGLAVVPLALVQSNAGTRAGWISEIDLTGRVVETPGIFLVGLEAPRPVLVASVAALLAATGVLVLVLRGNAGERRGALVAGGTGITGMALPLALALGPFDYFIYRNLLATAVPFALVLAAGFGAVRGGRLALALLAAFSFLALAVVAVTATEPKYGREDWRTAAELLGEAGGDRAVVATPGGTPSTPLGFYLCAPLLAPGGGAHVEELAVVAMARRPLGAIEEPRVPRAGLPPPPTGFRLVERVDTRYFTLLRYAAPGPRTVRRAELDALAVGSERARVYLQRARPGDRAMKPQAAAQARQHLPGS